MERELFVGCDVSKDTFHFCLRTRSGVLTRGEVKNTRKGVNNWMKELKKSYLMDRMLFCMEHTGIYVAIICRELHKLGAMVCLESSLQIKNSLGLQRGKSDKIDASRIAEYAMRFKDRLHPWCPQRKTLEELDHLCALRRRLIKARTLLQVFNDEARSFCEKEICKGVIAGSKTSLYAIDKDIKNVDYQIRELIRNDQSLKHLNELITSVPGIGIVTSCELILRTNEFTAFENAKKLACTAGVVPFEHSSGKSIRGKNKVSSKAHKKFKTLLHMCALSSITRKGEMREYYERKIALGKPKMVVLNAIRNKLVHRVFAVVRDNTMYQKNYRYKVA